MLSFSSAPLMLLTVLIGIIWRMSAQIFLEHGNCEQLLNILCTTQSLTLLLAFFTHYLGGVGGGCMRNVTFPMLSQCDGTALPRLTCAHLHARKKNLFVASLHKYRESWTPKYKRSQGVWPAHCNTKYILAIVIVITGFDCVRDSSMARFCCTRRCRWISRRIHCQCCLFFLTAKHKHSVVSFSRLWWHLWGVRGQQAFSQCHLWRKAAVQLQLLPC